MLTRILNRLHAFFLNRKIEKMKNQNYYDFLSKVEALYAPFGISFKNYIRVLNEEDSTENPSHYDIFCYWIAKKLRSQSEGKRLNILDVGNVKVGNMINSLDHNVSALVLTKPDDGKITSINYVKHDIANPLPFSSESFDAFTSPSTLHLIGLGRYGDRQDPAAFLTFEKELVRVLKKKAHAYLILPLGMDQLVYGMHFIYSFDTIVKLFPEFYIVDYMVDEYKRFAFDPASYDAAKGRFSKDVDTSCFLAYQYKILYLDMVKK